MNRTALLFCLLSLAARAQAPAAPETPVPPAPAPIEDDVCDSDDASDEDKDSEVLGALRLLINGENRALTAVEFQGLQHMPEPLVRALARVPARGALSPEQAARLLARLSRSGLFAKVTPTVRLAEGSAPVLVVTLEEHPFVTDVDLAGLPEHELHEVREELFQLPDGQDADDDDDEDDDEDAKDSGHRATQVDIETGHGRIHVRIQHCASPTPPRELLAYYHQDTFHPGIVWKGLTGALERGVEALHDEGYPLASLDATLTPDGKLSLRMDEGKVAAVDIQGVDEDVAARVREVLGIRAGDVLLRSDVRRAEHRLEEELPFVELEDVDLPASSSRIVEEREPEGSRHYRPRPEEPKESKHKKKRREPIVITGERRVVVRVKPRGASVNGELIPMHTQVTGFAPGLAGSLSLWDVRDRAHLTLDAALTIPLRWGGQRIPGDPEQTALQRRLNWLAGAKLQVPVLRLAEVGVQVYDFTDSNDRWRMSAIDSFIYSALLNRPDAEYFRRSGFTGFATWRFGSQWLAGAEYRRDTYASLVSFSPPFSLFRRDSAPFPNPAVEEGRMTSVVGRLEYASDGRRGGKTGSLFRNPELSLLEHTGEWPEHSAVRSLLTVEVGSPELGGDDRFRFWKLVSDNVLYVSTGREDGLRLRVRGAGGMNLPEQKREALGGWSALRGYGFKEFRGDASLLASAEYRWDFFGVFADVGTVHRDEAGWLDPRLGVGAQFYFGDSVQLSVAWRTDNRATIVPEARLLFVRPF